MPDTSAARSAIRAAYEHHRDVMGGMSMALLKMDAAGGLIYPDPLLPDDPPLPYPEDSPVWTDHALDSLPWTMLIGLIDDLQHEAGDHVA